MPVRTKKRLTDNKFEPVIVSLILRGPKENKLSLLKAARNLGYDIADSVPWKKAFSEYSDNELPGVVLSGARTKEGLTQKELADKLNITQGHVSEMESGKRTIGKAMAKRLSAVLNISYKVFL